MKVIINADDCGYNNIVNNHIENAINMGKITSTTIMANMYDLDGALKLYEKYGNKISFGIHLNLTEGEPIIKSLQLLKYGFYNILDDRIIFDGKFAEKFRYKNIPKYVQVQIYNEFKAQINILLNQGVKISHIDSHHHIHTSLSLLGVISQISKEFNIPKVRNIRNYVPGFINYRARKFYELLSRYYNKSYIYTDFFAIYEEYFKQPYLRKIQSDHILELMCHPGNDNYRREESMMLSMKYPSDFILINYNQI